MSDRTNHPYIEGNLNPASNAMLFDTPDALSSLMNRLQLTAEVYVNGDFCGPWAVDTSGAKRMPFHLIGRGEAWLHRKQAPPLHLSAGDLVLFPHDEQHTLSSEKNQPDAALINAEIEGNHGETTHMICGFFDFKSQASWPLLNALSPVIVMDLSEMSGSPTVRTLINLMLAELKTSQPGHFAVVNQLAYILFVEVVRQQINHGHIEQGLLAALFDPRISKALEVIHNRAGEHWSLESLAAQCAMSRTSFAQQFHHLVGTPAMQYLTNWRMHNATELLTTTNLSIASIAEQCGYETDASFRKAFKKITGRTPSDIRKSTLPTANNQ